MYRHTKHRVESFADAKKRCDTVKPLNRRNPNDREKAYIKVYGTIPVGERYRYWEIIKQVNPRKIVIHDYDSDSYYNRFTRNGIASDTNYSAIIWELSPLKDHETITIRNGGQGANTSRYTFLDNILPSNLPFEQSYHGGRQFIDGHYLPKTTDKNDYFLKFGRKVGTRTWTVLGHTYQHKFPQKRVNKKEKATWKPYADAFFEWMLPLIPLQPYEEHRWKDKPILPFSHYNGIRKAKNFPIPTFSLVGEIFKKGFEHDLAEVLMVEFLYRIQERPDDMSKLKRQWNDFVNKYLNLVKTTYPEPVKKGK
tara:strand:- start:228 stop:1154 length:927 start_codon:yes stop_codon:yes gene_type:complete